MCVIHQFRPYAYVSSTKIDRRCVCCPLHQTLCVYFVHYSRQYGCVLSSTLDPIHMFSPVVLTLVFCPVHQTLYICSVQYIRPYAYVLSSSINLTLCSVQYIRPYTYVLSIRPDPIPVLPTSFLCSNFHMYNDELLIYSDHVVLLKQQNVGDCDWLDMQIRYVHQIGRQRICTEFWYGKVTVREINFEMLE